MSWKMHYLHFRFCLFIFFFAALRMNWFFHGDKKVWHLSSNGGFLGVLFWFCGVIVSPIFNISNVLTIISISFSWMVLGTFGITSIYEFEKFNRIFITSLLWNIKTEEICFLTINLPFFIHCLFAIILVLLFASWFKKQ